MRHQVIARMKSIECLYTAPSYFVPEFDELIFELDGKVSLLARCCPSDAHAFVCGTNSSKNTLASNALVTTGVV
jgi:hypothetical protein